MDDAIKLRLLSQPAYPDEKDRQLMDRLVKDGLLTEHQRPLSKRLEPRHGQPISKRTWSRTEAGVSEMNRLQTRYSTQPGRGA